jgi:hypothetical protein
MESTGNNGGSSHRTFKMRQARRAASFIIFAVLALLVISALGNSCASYSARQRGAMILDSGVDKKSMSPMDYEAAGGYGSPGEAAAPSAPPSPPEQSNSSVFSQSAFAQEASVPGVKPMIVYNGSLSLKVAKLKEASDAVIGMLPRYNGYVSNMSEETAGSLQMISITARIDASKVMDFLAEAKKLGEVLNTNLTGDEVTEEFVDLQAQLSALRISEARLKDMLSKSGKLSDLLEIERELANKQTTINEVTGRMRYLQDRSRRATVEITLNTEAPPSPSSISFAWDFGQVFSQSWLSLKYTVRNFLYGVISFLVGAIFWLPALVVIILVLIGVWRWLRRKGIIAWSDEKKE